MSERNLTARDMLRFQTCERLLGCNQLTPEARYQQARTAQRLRNFWSTASLQPSRAAMPAPVGKRLAARSTAFSEAMVLTDLISLVDFNIAQSQVQLPLEILEYGGQERSVGLDFFGLSGQVPQRYILKHEKNTLLSPFAGGDLQGRYIGFVPRLLVPYQQLEFNWTNSLSGGLNTDELFLQAGLRFVRAMQKDNPYSYFTTSTDEDIKNYINDTNPETFFLEAVLPLANFPAVGATVQIRTPQMQRPLLILGATSNVSGVQAALKDESKYYTFTSVDDPLNKQPGCPLYKAPPLSLWACNSDYRNYNIYNMWPVPHLLERNTSLVIDITNGLNPNAGPGFVFNDTILTKSEQDARIVFLCRTV